MMKRILAGVLALVIALPVVCVPGWAAEPGVSATPAKDLIANFAVQNSSGSPSHLEQEMPIYFIQQENGYSSSYVKLRDIAYLIDFEVTWDKANPYVINIYTNKHYSGQKPFSGPATETETATPSSMTLYIDGVETPMEAYLINYNNYLKVRDLAKLIDFACRFSSGSKGSTIAISSRYPYKDGDPVFSSKDYSEERTIDYESPFYYGEASGSISDEPVVLSINNPWCRMDYFEAYASDELKARLASDEEYADWSREDWNALVQVLIDKDKILMNTSGNDVLGSSDNTLNPYYMYPMHVKSWGFGTISNLNLVSMPVHQNASVARILSLSFEDDPTDTYLSMTRATAQHILAEMAQYETDREKIAFLAREVCDRVTYSGYSSAKGLNSVHDDLWMGTFWQEGNISGSVCMGYCDMFEKICTAAGYIYAEGHGDNHQWDEVYLPDENKWVVVDCTWADAPDYNRGGQIGVYLDEYICCDVEDYENARTENLDTGHWLFRELFLVAGQAKRDGK